MGLWVGDFGALEIASESSYGADPSGYTWTVLPVVSATAPEKVSDTPTHDALCADKDGKSWTPPYYRGSFVTEIPTNTATLDILFGIYGATSSSQITFLRSHVMDLNTMALRLHYSVNAGSTHTKMLTLVGVTPTSFRFTFDKYKAPQLVVDYLAKELAVADSTRNTITCPDLTKVFGPDDMSAVNVTISGTDHALRGNSMEVTIGLPISNEGRDYMGAITSGLGTPLQRGGLELNMSVELDVDDEYPNVWAHFKDGTMVSVSGGLVSGAAAYLSGNLPDLGAGPLTATLEAIASAVTFDFS